MMAVRTFTLDENAELTVDQKKMIKEASEKPLQLDEDNPPRMQDPAYTNRLVQLRGRQKAVVSQMAALQTKIQRLGAEAQTRPEYADLTNRLARCEAELERVRKETLLAVRTRLLKDSAKKDNLKK